MTAPTIEIRRTGRWVHEWTVRGNPGWDCGISSAIWEDCGLIMASGHAWSRAAADRKARRNARRLMISAKRQQEVSIYKYDIGETGVKP